MTDIKFYLRPEEAAYVKSKGPGWLRRMVKAQMKLAIDAVPCVGLLVEDSPSFVEVKSRLLSGAELLHPKR